MHRTHDGHLLQTVLNKIGQESVMLWQITDVIERFVVETVTPG